MSFDWISDYRPFLLGKAQLTGSIIAEIIQRDKRIDDRDIDLCKSLTDQPLHHLDRFELRQIIRDELSDDKIAELNSLRAPLFERMASLLPEIARLLGSMDDHALRFFVTWVHSSCLDFAGPYLGPRRDKKLNQVRRTLESTKDAVNAALAELDSARQHIDIDFDDALTARLESEQGQGPEDPARFRSRLSFEALVQQLEVLQGVIDYKIVDLKRGGPTVRFYGGTTKADLVECAYDLHGACGGPSLVTTPGSDFSYICGLLFEIATGKSDESLAGAINRFARSSDRAKQDEYDQEREDEEVAIANNDNFHGRVSRKKYLLDQVEQLLNLSSEEGLSALGRKALDYQIESLRRQELKLEEEFGPFIVWVSQQPPATREAWRLEHEATEERLRNFEIAIGDMRRRLRRLGIDPSQFDPT